jgi:hypothetical protein
MSGDGDGAAEAPLEATAVWRGVHDAVMGGLVHEAAGRQSALNSIRTLLDLRADRLDSLPHLLEGEVEALSRLTAQLRTLPRHDEDRDIPSTGDFLPRVASLAGQHRGLDQLEHRARVETGAPVPSVPRAPLTRALLVLLARAGRRALEAGSDGVELSAAAADGRLRLEVAVPLPGPDARPPEVQAGPGPEAARLVREAVEGWGGSWSREEGEDVVVRYRLELPAGT